VKKTVAFLYITFILFFVFSCTMPSELEITGSPSLKFAVNKSFNEYFDKMFDEVLKTDNDEVHILNCTNHSLRYKTFFIHINAFDDEEYDCDINEADLLDDGESSTININGIDIPGQIKDVINDEISNAKKYFVIQEDIKLPSPSEPFKVPFIGFDEYLKGFGFSGVKSKMYMSGSDIVDVIDIKLYHYISEDEKIQISKNEDSTPSDTTPYEKIDIASLKEYNGLDLPPGGIDIDIMDLLNSKDDFYITYDVKLDKGTHVDLSWFDDTQSIIVEIVLWLPMVFEATEDGALIDFSDYFDDIGGFFNKAAGNEYIESMNLTIGLKPENPFGNGIFVIKDDNYSIQTPMDENSFSFNLSDKDLDYINNNEFNPGFSIVYKKGDKLDLPNGDVMISTISLHAKVKYNMEL